MKVSKFLFLFLFVSTIVGMRKISGGSRIRGSPQRGNEQKDEQQNIPDTSKVDIGQSNPIIIIPSFQGEMQRIAFESLLQQIELKSTYYGMIPYKLESKMFYHLS